MSAPMTAPSIASAPTIAAVIICYNEETVIRDALTSVAGWVDEIVVVDSESTDRTVDVCHEFTSKVIVHSWCGFSAQRNFAIDQVCSDWILMLDADEVVPPELAQEIQTAIVTPSTNPGDAAKPTAKMGADMQPTQQVPKGQVATAYRIPRRSWFCGRFLQWGGNYPDYVLRLFKRGSGRYSDRYVHETLQIDGPPGYLHHPLLHYTYPTLDVYFSKLDRYSRLAALQMQQDGKRWRASAIIFGPMTAFISRFVLKRGFRDGWQGFIYAALSAFQVFAKYARLWDLERWGEHATQLDASRALLAQGKDTTSS